MCFKYLALIGFMFLAYQIIHIDSRVELTNFVCIPYDETFAKFTYCRIKSVNRTYKYFSMNVKLLQVPVTNITVNISVLKRLNGYKPFLYNITFDACKYLASKNKNPVIKYFHDFIFRNSNMNHTCPFDHDLIVDKVSIDFLNHHMTNVLPIPPGDYAVFTNWYAYGINRGAFRIYSTKT